MDIDNDSSSNIVKKAKIKILNLSESSRQKYKAVYKSFMDWRILKNVNSFSENVLIAYLSELSKKYESPSLWAQYYMLKSILLVNNSVNIGSYTLLRLFLKRRSEVYKTKQIKTFNLDDLNKFTNEAPDSIYLATKVALIVGINGACRADVLHSMTINDFDDLGEGVIVTIRTTKTKKIILTDHFYQIFKKYAALRPANCTTASFFLNYRNGKTTLQKIGIKKFEAMGNQIASFLKLPDADLYTGHIFKRSAIVLQNTEGCITWSSGDSVKNKMDTTATISKPVNQSTTQPTENGNIRSLYRNEINIIVLLKHYY